MEAEKKFKPKASPQPFTTSEEDWNTSSRSPSPWTGTPENSPPPESTRLSSILTERGSPAPVIGAGADTREGADTRAGTDTDTDAGDGEVPMEDVS
jgi:hypothetical protein